MDPQKLPNSNRPEDANTPNPADAQPTDAQKDVVMSEESSATPGSVVTGEQTTPDSSPQSATTPDMSTGNVAAFMREPATAGTPPAPVSGKKKTSLIVGIIAAVLLVFGGATAAYVAFMAPKADKILQTALANSFAKDKVTSVGFEGTMSITESTSSTSFDIKFSGAGSQDGKLNMTGTVEVPAVSPVTFDVRSTDADTYYLKAGGLADIAALLEIDPSLAPYAPLVASINDQWYEVSSNTLEEFGFGESAPTTTELSDADRQKITDAYNNNQFLAVKETLADEKIAGVDSYHYKVAVDGAKLKSFVAALEAANVESLGLTQPLFDEMKKGIDDTDFSKYPVDVWIAKDSKLFTQFALTMQQDDATLDLKVTLKDYNKEVVVEKPEGAKSIMTLLTSFYQLFLGASDLPAEL